MKFLISCASSFCAVILAAYAPTTLADEPAKNAVIFGNTTLDEVSLIGLPKDEALRRLGAPEEIAGPEDGYQTYDYPKRHQLAVVFYEGKLVQYMVRADSKARTTKDVTMGAHLAAVTAKYGDFSREEDVTEWFAGDEGKVLYHHAEFKRFKLNYTDADILFMFDDDRNVNVFWVGFFSSKAREQGR